MQAISDNIESIPGYGLVSTAYESYAPDYLKTKDPFYAKENGEEVRRRAPIGATENQKQAWKRVMKKAWNYDRNFCCGCVGFDIGVGIIPIINILPVIGPILAYTLQGSLIRVCGAAGMPASAQAKMSANCATDFVISLCPVLGTIFSWMFGCATRNAAMFDTWLGQSIAKEKQAVASGAVRDGRKQPLRQQKVKPAQGPVYRHDTGYPASQQKPRTPYGPEDDPYIASSAHRSPPTSGHTASSTAGATHGTSRSPRQQQSQSRTQAPSRPRPAAQRHEPQYQQPQYDQSRSPRHESTAPPYQQPPYPHDPSANAYAPPTTASHNPYEHPGQPSGRPNPYGQNSQAPRPNPYDGSSQARSSAPRNRPAPVDL